MGKVWLKTRFDPGMNMEIPHSWNMANAMYGFMEMGAEIVPYREIGDIIDRVERTDIVLDYVDQCRSVFAKFDVLSDLPDYPEELGKIMGRKVWKDIINNIARNEGKWSAGYFVKPVRDKAFTGRVIKIIHDLMGCGNSQEDFEVLVSEPIEIAAEWRCFIMYDDIADVRPYGSFNGSRYDGYLYHYDSCVLQEMMKAFVSWDLRPMGCSMDICRTKDGRTLLVEINDAYALGCYGLPGVVYAKLISARWSQIMGVEDEFRF